MWARRVASSITLSAVAGLLTAGAPVTPAAPIRVSLPMHVAERTRSSPTPDPPNNLLQYYGGKVISNVKVVAVFWGPNVDPTVTAQIGGFYTAIVASPYLDWFEEYDTLGRPGTDSQPGSEQHIGRGSFTGVKTITPINKNTNLTNDDIGNELAAQIAGGGLPAPELDAKGNVDTLYMFDLPSGMTVDLMGSAFCQVYCAYHFTKVINGKSVPYGVHPDIKDCGGRCGGGFNSVTAIHSHELGESITDAEIGLVNFSATAVTRPAAWYCDQQGCGENGDICVQSGDSTIAGFTVQKLWSNHLGACVATIPICDGTNAAACRSCTKFDDGVSCVGSTPHCETSTASAKSGECVACVDSSECKGGSSICDKSPGSTFDTCRPCVATDCTGAKPVCETAGSESGQCVQCNTKSKSACTGATAICDTTLDTCVGCVTSATCAAATPICDPKSKTCRACTADPDCAPNGVCDTSSDSAHGRCVQCTVDAHCSGGTCDTTTHACSPGSGANGGDGGIANGDSPLVGSCGCNLPGKRAGGGASFAALLFAAAMIVRRRRR